MTDSRTTEEMMSDLEELAAMREEPLHPDLAACVEDTALGPMIKHPMIYDILPINGYTNRRYEQQKRLLAEAEKAGEWHTCVFLHERPYRLMALIEYVLGRDENEQPLPARCFDSTVRELVADVWCDSENIHENIEEWGVIMSGHQPGEPLIFGDQPAFDALPTRDGCIEVWRGDCNDGGWSWTTSRKTALFFCRRWDENNDLLHGWVDKADVFGYITARSETEVMVSPASVRLVSREPYCIEMEEG